jgi:hypothetical protein
MLHELQHLLNPNNSANNQKEYEEPAYRETIKQLCKVAGCAMATQEEKDAVCEYIKASNQELCRLGAEQECCADCPDQGKVHCEGSSGGATGGGGSGGGGGGGGLRLLGGGPFLDTTYDEFYALGDVRGRISLNVGFQTLRFLLWDSTGTRDFTYDCTDPGITFTATTFTQIASTAVLLGGYDSTTGQGELVRLELSPSPGSCSRPTRCS